MRHVLVNREMEVRAEMVTLGKLVKFSCGMMVDLSSRGSDVILDWSNLVE
jgi:hypothetical protein